MKTINRNNYEEYFLLYADSELDAETKLAVENFIQQNTDLAVELEMLLRTISKPGNVVFTDKEALLRTEGNSINETNYEEHFLLYIDNELSAVKREEVEMYVLQHPKLQNEFTALKHAVLLPETISYEDKKDLYRTEKRRTVYLKPWRLAAAAIFIGVCAIGWWLLQKPAQTIAIADNHSMQKPTEPGIVVKPADTVQQQVKQSEETTVQKTLPSSINKNASEKHVVKKKEPALTKNEINVAEHQPMHEENKIHNIIDQNINLNQNQQPVIENNDVAIESGSSNKQEEPVTLHPQTQENNGINNNGYKMYDVAYKEINTSDDDNSLHVGAFDLNKNKVKNLFKKAGRLFGNKANNNANEDGKLQVANFEIQTNKQ